MKITVYSTATCPYCKMLKDYLASKNIAFEEKYVDQDEEAKNEMMERSDGFLGVPFVYVQDGEAGTPIIGFDKHKLNTALHISE